MEQSVKHSMGSSRRSVSLPHRLETRVYSSISSREGSRQSKRDSTPLETATTKVKERMGKGWENQGYVRVNLAPLESHSCGWWVCWPSSLTVLDSTFGEQVKRVRGLRNISNWQSDHHLESMIGISMTQAVLFFLNKRSHKVMNQMELSLEQSRGSIQMNSKVNFSQKSYQATAGRADVKLNLGFWPKMVIQA